MGNACDLCEENIKSPDFVPFSSRGYKNYGTKSVQTFTQTRSEKSPFRGFSLDGPDLENVVVVTVPQAKIAKAKAILQKQVSKNPFLIENIYGKKFPALQLKGQKMIYDGEWRDGIPHGKGKAYYDNGTYFQGYFTDGAANCKDGIVIYPNGTYYRGEVKNSRAQGKGTLAYRNEEMVYTGDWFQDKPHGKGVQQFRNGDYYQGDFSNGQKTGQGYFRWRNGSSYKGQFLKGKMHGKGYHISAQQQIYEGQFKQNKKHGYGIQQTPRVGKYTGYFYEDKIQGEGQFIFFDGRVFKGFFVNGYPEGKGTMKLSNSQVFGGVWKNGQIYEIDGEGRVASSSNDSSFNLPTNQSLMSFRPK